MCQHGSRLTHTMLIDGVKYKSHCAECNKGFKSRQAYLQHKKAVHNVMTYIDDEKEEEQECKKCGKKFHGVAALDNHMCVKHGAEFKCFNCNMYGTSSWAQSHAMKKSCKKF